MSKIAVLKVNGEKLKEMELEDGLFSTGRNDQLLYDAVKIYRMNQRQGTSKTKNRGEVSGGGAKPWRQKGTGRARSGSNTSPVWVRGGRCHGPKPRDYHAHFPKQMKVLAVLTALGEKVQNKTMKVLEAIQLEPKTSAFIAVRKACGLMQGKVLLVVDQFDKNLFLAVRNIPDVEIIRFQNLNAYSILDCRWIVFSGAALEKTVDMLKQKKVA